MYIFHYSIFCAVVSSLLFLYGFFLLNYDGEDPVSPKNWSGGEQVSSSIDKIIFMIIDGVRLDFIASEQLEHSMPYLHHFHINSDETCIFPCRVHLPTVTMPRIKALTVGTVPSFVDIALNFGSSRLTKDNVLNQLVLAGKKIVFYGDDTWIKLFPDTFSRHEGTTSFFVSDFVEVDANVTRNVNEELNRNDWDVMILHYLGLDHIGHVEGSSSPKIPGKLREMDAVIEKLHRYLLNWRGNAKKNYLMIICGDHGMKDSGGHGGSTLPEVMVPFVTFGVACVVHREISQVDVAVTLSTLLGLPIPKGNVGKLIDGLMHHLTEKEKSDAYLHNAGQLMDKFVKLADEVSLFEARTLLKRADDARNEKDYRGAIVMYEILLNKICETLVRSLTKYDAVILYCAIFLAFQSCFLVGVERCPKSVFLYAVSLTSVIICISYEYCHYFRSETLLCSSWIPAALFSWMTFSIISFNTALLARSAKTLVRRCRLFVKIVVKDPILLFLVFGSICHIVSSTATSFIEEEHMIWYFLWTTFLILIGLRYHAEKKTIVLFFSSLVLHRVLRKLNQTGDKWSALPDINDWFRTPDNKYWLSIYTVFGLICTFLALNQVEAPRDPKRSPFHFYFRVVFKCADLISLLMVYNCRAAMDEVLMQDKLKNYLSSRGELEFQTILILLLISLCTKAVLLREQVASLSSLKNTSEILINFLMIWSSLLLRPYNIVLVSSLFVVSEWLGEIFKNESHYSIKIVIAHHWLAQVYFFYQGNSNSFSSIDVTPGYIGQTVYNPLVAGVLIIFSMYALPILAYSCMIRHILIREQGTDGIRKRKSSTQLPANVLLCLTNFYLTLFMAITTFQRNHLFIWSVFSPKMIFLCAYNLLLYAVLTSLQFCGYFSKLSSN